MREDRHGRRTSPAGAGEWATLPVDVTSGCERAGCAGGAAGRRCDPLSVLARQGVLVNAAQLLIGVPMAAAGFIVARRQPGNPIGWLLLLTLVGILLSLDANPYVLLVCRLGYRLPFGPVALVLEPAYLVVLFVVLPPVFLLFPDGVLPSPRWRWVLRSYLAVAVTLVAFAYATGAIVIAARGIQIDSSGGLTGIDHPSGSTAWVSEFSLFVFRLLVFWPVFAARLMLSRRRASGDRRQQLKWLMAGSSVAVIGTVVSKCGPCTGPGRHRSRRRSGAARVPRGGDLEVPAV